MWIYLICKDCFNYHNISESSYTVLYKHFANSINTDSDFSSNEIDTMTKTSCAIRLNLPCDD